LTNRLNLQVPEGETGLKNPYFYGKLFGFLQIVTSFLPDLEVLSILKFQTQLHPLVKCLYLQVTCKPRDLRYLQVKPTGLKISAGFKPGVQVCLPEGSQTCRFKPVESLKLACFFSSLGKRLGGGGKLLLGTSLTS